MRISETPVSLAEVARRAGVSSATASKALNGRVDVNEATRARVEQAARDLGYLPNSLARGLMGARTGTVGVVTTDLDGRFALPILMGVEDSLGIDRILSFLCDARGDDLREESLIASLLARRVDGLILVGRQTDPRPSLGAIPVPVVYAYAESDDPSDMSVTVDNADVGRRAARHLLDIGRRRIAQVAGEASHGASRDRVGGASSAIAAAGLLEGAGRVRFGDWSEGWGRAAAHDILDQDGDVDAILCGSDQVARGVLDTLHERRVRVPDDVAVIGVDNWEPLAAHARPPLTTVDLQLQQLGRVAAHRLQRATTGEIRGGVERLPGSLIIRDSTVLRR
ncbi:LacI family DNA-binding transcriptional regulator [Microbacterium gilvum]|uniref:LacI family DNA-binding transcriptional regulator n=1 Tax=Microbacterium gilvum TaxID=1336204 RepID=A0ABP9A873_9MICO